MFVGQHPQLTGTAALVLGAIGVWLTWLAFNKLLDRRDTERQQIMAQANSQNNALLNEIKAHRELIEQSMKSGDGRSADAFDRLAASIEESAATMKSLGDQLTVSLERQGSHSDETRKRLDAVNASLDMVKGAVNRIEGGMR